jgi:hypothetical protein
LWPFVPFRPFTTDSRVWATAILDDGPRTVALVHVSMRK